MSDITLTCLTQGSICLLEALRPGQGIVELEPIPGKPCMRWEYIVVSSLKSRLTQTQLINKDVVLQICISWQNGTSGDLTTRCSVKHGEILLHGNQTYTMDIFDLD